MNEHTDLLPNLSSQEDAFEVQLRGYSRKQVDDFVARCRSQVRELEERLGRSLDETEHLRQETQALRQQSLVNRPAHEEVSERISQILKLADDEAHAQKNRADDDIKKQLSDAQQEADRSRKEAREQAEHMLTAAQEQAERAISSARSEADKTRTTARAEADHMTADAHKKADHALSAAKAQAKQTLDEATARAAAIHDGAERRLNLLSTRHAETIRRLTDILDGVSGLVAAETARPSLEDEVDQTVAKAIGHKPGEAGNTGQNTGANPAVAPGRPGNGIPHADAAAAARAQRPAPGGPGAPVPSGAPRPAVAPRTGAGIPAGPGSQPGSPQPGTQGQPVPDPVLVHPRGGAHEAPRGGAHEAPRGRQASPTVPAPAPLPADQVRPAASGPGSDSDERAGRLSPAHRAGDSNYTGAIDKDETTEGVRIVREQRQH
jgi:cell division septum initiation protein DivIVA